MNQSRMPVDVIGLPVPVLDEETEMFRWDTANYFSAPLPPRWHKGDPWPFAYARTLPGYPAYSSDVARSRLNATVARASQAALAPGHSQRPGPPIPLTW